MMSGMIKTTIQAPSMNLVTTWMMETIPVATPPIPLSAAFHFHPGALERSQCITIPSWDNVKQMKTPNRVERDERVGLAAKDPDDDRGDQTKRDDAVRKRQSIAARGQLPRHVSVIG